MPLREDYISQFGKSIDSLILPELDFHLGKVERVFNSSSDFNSYIGGIANIPGDISQVILITPTKSKLSFSKRPIAAQPMLRGINDSITRGDAVLFANIEGRTLYLGPLNITNNPNYTPNHTENRTRKSTDDGSGYSKLYPSDFVAKLTKSIDPLDFPNIKNLDPQSELVLDSKFSDLILEGRHRNSIRIGSRHKYPLITISNNRINTSPFETRNDGSHISMLSLGSLRDYFPKGPNNGPNEFLLSCDTVTKTNSDYTAYPVAAGNDDVDGQNKFNYDYGKVQPDVNEQNEFDQMIIFSDRITFDAQQNDFTVSALRNINFGAGKNFTLTNKGYSVFESKNIYIGKGAKQRSQPMVLGEELRRLLVSILRLINESRALVQGVPIPLVKQDTSPLLADITNIMQEFRLGTMPAPGAPIESPASEYDTQMTGSNMEMPLGDRTLGGATFFSNHHFIETNRPKP